MLLLLHMQLSTGAGNSSVEQPTSQQLAALQLASSQAGGCNDEVMCPDTIDPVCSTDGKDYDNECEAKRCGATIACKSSCQECNLAGTCPKTQAPVCDTSSKTYANACLAKAAGAPVACLGQCPCGDLLAKLSKKGGTLLVPSDAFLRAQLTQAGLGEAAVMASHEARSALLASHISYTNLLKKDGTKGQSEAGSSLQYLAKGPNGKPVVTDLSTGVPSRVQQAFSLCPKVRIVQVGADAAAAPGRDKASVPRRLALK
ncbi:hypothetical protein N2152v2_010181 [Parachlorella kessleri]